MPLLSTRKRIFVQYANLLPSFVLIIINDMEAAGFLLEKMPGTCWKLINIKKEYHLQ